MDESGIMKPDLSIGHKEELCLPQSEAKVHSKYVKEHDAYAHRGIGLTQRCRVNHAPSRREALNL
jgi:hypothetical protein